MTLLELCEPLFLYVCRLNRTARRTGRADPLQAQSEIHGLLEDMRSQAASDARLLSQYEKVEDPLVYFVDHMMINGDAGLTDWPLLALEKGPQGDLAGDQQFFVLFHDTMNDLSEAATERLGVYYVCMGLGFRGMHRDEPQTVKRFMMQCCSRMRGQIDAAGD